MNCWYCCYNLMWFNELLVPLIIKMGTAQGFHKTGHLVASW